MAIGPIVLEWKRFGAAVSRGDLSCKDRWQDTSASCNRRKTELIKGHDCGGGGLFRAAAPRTCGSVEPAEPLCVHRKEARRT